MIENLGRKRADLAVKAVRKGHRTRGAIEGFIADYGHMHPDEARESLDETRVHPVHKLVEVDGQFYLPGEEPEPANTGEEVSKMSKNDKRIRKAVGGFREAVKWLQENGHPDGTLAGPLKSRLGVSDFNASQWKKVVLGAREQDSDVVTTGQKAGKRYLIAGFKPVVKEESSAAAKAPKKSGKTKSVKDLFKQGIVKNGVLLSDLIDAIIKNFGLAGHEDPHDEASEEIRKAVFAEKIETYGDPIQVKLFGEQSEEEETAAPKASGRKTAKKPKSRKKAATKRRTAARRTPAVKKEKPLVESTTQEPPVGIEVTEMTVGKFGTMMISDNEVLVKDVDVVVFFNDSFEVIGVLNLGLISAGIVDAAHAVVSIISRNNKQETPEVYVEADDWVVGSYHTSMGTVLKIKPAEEDIG